VYALDRQSAVPLFVQLCNDIRQRIIAGQIKHDSRLPASRNLAIELGLSRSTVTNAYEQLVAEGYVEGRKGSGYFVCPVGEIDVKPKENKCQPTISKSIPPIRQYKHPSFPDMRLFPYRQWAQCMSRVARLNPESLVSVTDSFGDIELRRSIAQFLRDWRGLDASPEQILITAGSIDALEICVRTLAEVGDTVGLENPGYQPLRNIVLNLGMKPLWLNRDERDVEVPAITNKSDSPTLSILTPSHHFPLGGAMSPLRRREFLQWAEQTNSWIIEDDYDSEFRYAGSPIQALAGFDTTERTIYVGTFSKVFSVGLRLGFLVSPPELIPKFSSTLARYGVKAATTAQRALSLFMDNGEFYRHIRRTRRIYSERRKILLTALQENLGDIVTVEDHAAGMQLLVALPDNFDDQLIVKAARKQGVVVNALSSHYAVGKPRKGLVLGFCGFVEEEILTSVSVIDRVIRSG
jgi:GntR family transcriptional regulator/MocR family aminotransferase